jgi:hypothetical protein
MIEKIDMLSRIRHIFPYLYYRFYQYLYKQDKDCNPELRAWGFVCLIKTSLYFSFVCIPIRAVLYDSTIVFLSSFIIVLILMLRKSTHEQYKEMFSLWNNETESQRRNKGVFLIFFCIFAMFSVIPVIVLMKICSLI